MAVSRKDVKEALKRVVGQMLEKLSIDFPLSDQGAALFLQLDRDVTPNNIGYKIYEGVMGLFGYIEIIVIPHSSKLSHLFGCMRDNFELKWIISTKILIPSKR